MVKTVHIVILTRVEEKHYGMLLIVKKVIIKNHIKNVELFFNFQ